MRRTWLSTGIVLAACAGEDHGPPFVCDALEQEVPIELGRRPSTEPLPRPLQAGDEVQTYAATPIEPEPRASLAYRAAVLGCMLGLEEVPGSVRTWAENTNGWTLPHPLRDPEDDPWRTFEVEDVTLYVAPPKSSDEERFGALVGRRDVEIASLEVLPDEIGFGHVQDAIARLEAHGLLAPGSFSIPASFEERPPLSPARTRASFRFFPRFHGIRQPFDYAKVAISLADDGTPVSLTIEDVHFDAAEVVTLAVGETEASMMVHETAPEGGFVERDETLASTDYGLSRHLVYRNPDDVTDAVVTLSLTEEGASARAATGGRVDTSDWW
jgi:hypothetical protein